MNKRFWLLIAGSLGCSGVAQCCLGTWLGGSIFHGFFVLSALVLGVAGVWTLATRLAEKSDG